MRERTGCESGLYRRERVHVARSLGIVEPTIQRAVSLGLALALLVFGFQVLSAPRADALGGFNLGDVFLGGRGAVGIVSPDGSPNGSLNPQNSNINQTAGMCFDAQDNAYVTQFNNLSPGKITKFDSAGNILVSSWGGPWNDTPESCVVDASGNIYVGNVHEDHTRGGDIRKLNTAGVLLDTYNASVGVRGADWIDLAGDQCTILYTSEAGTVYRFNVCTRTQLTNFVTGLPEPCYAVRIRANSEVLVACATGVVRLSPTGSLIQTYPTSTLPGATTDGLFGMTLDTDGTSFWTGDINNGDAWRVDMATGAVLTYFDRSGQTTNVAVFGSNGPVGFSSVPPPQPPAGGPLDLSELFGGLNPSQNQYVCSYGPRPINCTTGSFWHTFTDIAIPGRGRGIQLDRTYDSRAAGTNGPFGFGWSSTYDMSIEIDAGSGAVTVHQENGSTVTFTPNGTGGYTAPPRVLATLAQNQDGTFTFTRRAREKYVFSSAGVLSKQIDLNGYVTTLSYNGSNQLTTVTDRDGRTLTFTYHPDGLVSGVADQSGRSVTYAYESGNLTSVIDVEGGITLFTYDANHLLKTWKDPRGGLTQNTYDGSGRVTEQLDPMDRKTTYAYAGDNFSEAGGTTTITDPKGFVTVMTFNFGLLSLVTKGHGTGQAATWVYRYDPDTLGLTLEINPNGGRTTRTYDPQGNVKTVTDPIGRVTKFEYNSFNQVTKGTDPLDVATSYTYDGVGNLQEESRPLTGTSQIRKTTYTYGDPQHPGDVTTMIDPDNKTWTYTYDEFGYRDSVTDPLGNKTTYDYDSIGRVTSMVSPRGNVAGANPADFTTTYTYNGFGDQTSMTDPLSHQTVRVYDKNRNLTKVTDANTRVTQNDYNANDELITVTRANQSILSYEYDGNGNRTVAKDGKNNPTTYTYDALNRVTSMTDPLDRKTTYTYDLASNLRSMTDPAGRKTIYFYDRANQRVQITYSDGATPNVTNITYDDAGRRTGFTDGTGSSTFTWDSLGRLAEYRNGTGQVVSYGYNLRGNVTSITYPGGAGRNVSRVYDDAGRLASLTDWLGNDTTFDYDRDNNLASQAHENGVTTTFTPDAANRLMAISHARSGNTLASFTYSRNPVNLVSSVTPTGVGQANETYDYTSLNQLKSVNSIPYAYDDADNITTLASATQTYDNANQVLTASVGSDTTQFSYDSLGSRTDTTPPTGPPSTYRYDQARRLVGVARPPSNWLGAAAGQDHNLVLRSDGTVWGWGKNASGQLGNGSTTDASSAVQVSGLTDVIAIAAGRSHSLALKSNGTVWAWGFNSNGQLGNGTKTSSSTPVQVSGLTGVTAIAAGTAHSIALKSDATVWNWGSNAFGQMGQGGGNTQDKTTPVKVKNFTGAAGVAAGANHNIARKTNGTVWAWGENGSGQLGNGTTTKSSTPVQVSGLTSATGLGGGELHSLAIKSDGTAWAWGANSNGQLGNGTTANSSVPVQVSGLTGVTGIAGGLGGGFSHSAAMKSNGTLWAWGNNSFGELGNGTTTSSNVPVQVQNLTGVTAFAVGRLHNLAIKSDWTVWTWGFGALLTGSSSSVTRPIQATMLYPTAAYTYDGDGLRIKKAVGGTTSEFAWDKTHTIPQLLFDGSTSYIYDDNGLPIEQIDGSGNVLFHHRDQIGSTRVLTDGSGTVVATYTYDAYGKTIDKTGTATTPLQFAGQYTDSETGFQYLRARYYDPATGQFLTRDPMTSMTQEPYQYASGDPLNRVDPAGLCSWNPLAGDNCYGEAMVKGMEATYEFFEGCNDSLKDAARCTSVVAGGVAVVATGGAAAGAGAAWATVGSAAGYVSVGASGVQTAIECLNGGGLDRACVTDVASTLVGGGAAGAARRATDDVVKFFWSGLSFAATGASNANLIRILPVIIC